MAVLRSQYASPEVVIDSLLAYKLGNFEHFLSRNYIMLPVYFAPLQGYTEAPYRRVHNAVCGGVAKYYTPFIRLEHGQIRKKDLREALPEHNQGVCVVPQVIANGADEFSLLVEKLISIGHEEIDINMGCPFPLQTRTGRGSGILPHPDHVESVLTAAQRIGEERGIRFSLKMRLGQESPEECLALLPIINQVKLEHVTMHPRIGRNQYKGELDMETFRNFYEQSQNPVVFNGMLLTPEDMQQIEQQFPRLKALMIGRGLLSRPTLAKEYLTGQVITEAEACQHVLAMHRELFAYYEQAIEGGEPQLVQKMHSFWEYQEPLFGHKLVKQVLKSGNLRRYREAVSSIQSLLVMNK